MTIAFGVISVLVATFGMEGRGTWSRSISIVGGLLWTASVAYSFFDYGWKGGLLFLLGTFILAAILSNVFKPLLNPHGR